MATHTLEDRNRLNGPVIPGDNYVFGVNGGFFELVSSAENYGAGSGIRLSRVMWQRDPVEIVSMTSSGSVQVVLATGYVQISVAEDVEGGEVIFGRATLR